MTHFADLRPLFVVLLLSVSTLGHGEAPSITGLTPLDDGQLSGITGREGVALDFTYTMNAYYEDGPGYAAGDPLSSLANCEGLHNPCSLGIAVNNRDGMWIMLKDLYGIQKIRNFWLDGMETANVGTVAGVADERRFMDGANCVLPGGGSRTPCLPGSPSMPALAMQYGPHGDSSDGGFDTFEADVEWHLHIGRVTVQYDDPVNGLAYLPANDQAGSFMTYQITDMHQNAAKFDYDGRVVMFGW